MQRTPAATPSEISELAHCCAVFVPGDSARTGRVAFWRLGDAPPTVAAGTVDELTVVSAGAGGVERIRVPAALLPVRAALPVLTGARAAAQAYRARAFRGTAAVLGLQLVARGLRLPGLSAANHGAWWARPLSASDAERVRELAAAMPPDAHAVPLERLESTEPPRLPDPERLLRAFLDAVADAPPSSPAASLAVGGPPTRCGNRTTCRGGARGPRRSPPVTTRAYGSRYVSRRRGWRRPDRMRQPWGAGPYFRCPA